MSSRYAALVADAEVMRYLRGGPIDRAAAMAGAGAVHRPP
jgi:hypothetical protein